MMLGIPADEEVQILEKLRNYNLLERVFFNTNQNFN